MKDRAAVSVEGQDIYSVTHASIQRIRARFPPCPALSSETWALKRATTVNPSVRRREGPLWRAVISHPRKNNTHGRPTAERRRQPEEWCVKAGRKGKSPSVPAGVRSLASLAQFYPESCPVAVCPSTCSNTFIYQSQAAWRPSVTLLEEPSWTESWPSSLQWRFQCAAVVKAVIEKK